MAATPFRPLGTDIWKTVIMFNIHGDENYRAENLRRPAGVKYLCWHHVYLGRHYFALARLPGHATTASVICLWCYVVARGVNRQKAFRMPSDPIGAMPAALILAALGIEYMLENALVRHFPGQLCRPVGWIVAVILVLLGLTVYQGYEQCTSWSGLIPKLPTKPTLKTLSKLANISLIIRLLAPAMWWS